MPEGHTLHRLARSLADEFGGRAVISTSPQGRFAGEAAEVTGHALADAEAVGKHLFVSFDDVLRKVHVHLGLAGRFDLGSGAAPEPAGAIRWRLEGDRGYADLRGPAACELVDAAGMATILAKVGPDPLREDADPDIGWARVHGYRKSIAELLMDQRITAGVGNIFRAEVLYRHHIDPHMAGNLLRRGEWDTIWDDLVGLMHIALAAGRIDTVYPQHTPQAMGRPPRIDAHGGEVYVYRRAGMPCYVCGSKVRTELLGGRNLFWCARCQPKTRRRVPR
jgi:formamidopyrimidine-DNA glycosylase